MQLCAGASRLKKIGILLIAMSWIETAGATAEAAVLVSPSAVVLDNPEASQQLLVSVSADGRRIDRTRQVQYSVADPQVARIDSQGLVTPLSEGETEITIQDGAESSRIPVVVRGLKQPTPISFEHQVIPVLTKAACNTGGCHGKAEGQNGFKLSVFGFDAAADYEAIVKTGRGRRVSTSLPDRSLLLLKGTAEMPHGGGRKLERGSLKHQRLRRWITEGASFVSSEISPAHAIEVEPEQQILLAGGTQQLRVTAVDAAGNRHCVTTEAEYISNAETIAAVDPRGWIQATDIPGEAAILVRYMGHVAVCRVTLPRPGTQFQRPPETNFIDKLVWDKLERLGIQPSDPASEEMFLRRVYLDTIGTLPAPAEARAFLTSTDPQKRAALVDQLLRRNEYADYWTMRWSDILRVDRDNITPQGAVAITRWLHRQFAENRPYDQLVREILTAQGDSTAESPAAFYKVLKTPEELSRSVSQLFLGIRIECAQCHHHPFERWGQEDYFALAGFFTGVGRKPLPTGIEAIYSRGGTDLKHPRTGELLPTRALGAVPADFSQISDRRVALADWMTGPENPFFARAIANRLWSHYFGRGLVEPLDDLRATNPATNEPLLTALAQHLRDVKYDLHAFTRTVLNSRVYQLSSEANPSNAGDEQNFSHAAFKALPAEVLLDAISEATGVPEKFESWPEGYRAIQIWDNRLPSYFFRIFGRPIRASVCECERSNEPSIAQALHLMNSPEIIDKIHPRKGRVALLIKTNGPGADITDDLFLSTLSRFPTAQERALVTASLSESGADRQAAWEDVLWALLNRKEFIYNH
jgi:uncharacterized protein YjdB